MFKKGDVVLCIDDDSNEHLLTKGKEYIVIDPDLVENDFIEVKCDRGYVDMFFSTRFKLKESLEKENTRRELIEELFNSIEKDNTMKKEFIPYEEALILKALGFEEPCFGLFAQDESLIIKQMPNQQECDCYFGGILAPLGQQAFNFFKEKGYVINVYSYANDGKEWSFLIKNKTIATSDLIYLSEEEAQHACLRELIYLENLKKGL